MTEAELIRINNLKIKINANKENLEKSLLEEIDFSFFENEIICLIGENGVGKTIFAKCLANLLNYENIFVEGEIIFNNKKLNYSDLQKINKNENRSENINKIIFLREIQKNGFNPILKIKKQFIFLIQNYFEVSNKIAKRKFYDFLSKCNFLNISKRILNSYPKILSGGEIQKLLLLMSLMLKPKILILDEPTISIDENIKKKFLNEILYLKNKFNFSCIIISHDFKFLKNISKKFFLFENKKIRQIENINNFIIQNDIKKNFSFFENRKYYDNKFLNVKNLTVFFDNKFFSKKLIFKNISFNLSSKENLIIFGNNVAGKSSLCEIISGFSKNFFGDFSYFFDENEYLFKNGNIKNFKKIRKKIQMVFQDSLSAFDFRKNIYTTLTEGILVRNEINETDNNFQYFFNEIIEEFEITNDILKNYPQKISGGERQKILIARSLIINPRLLILDEAFSQISRINIQKIINFLKKFQEKNDINYIIVSHDDYILEKFNCKILKL